MDPHEFLKTLTIVLCTAGVTIVVFERLRQPVLLGYILAGVIVGPHLPIPLHADRQVVQTLSELGVVLLMFSLGLEFSLRRLLQVGPTAGLTAVVESSFMLWIGFMIARAFGWTPRESLFTGAIIAISSTTIIAKAFDENRVKGHLREFVVGVLIVEDLIAILLMAILTALSSGEGLSFGTVAESGGRLAAFLAGLLVLGLLLVPRVIRLVSRVKRPEMTLVTSIGICFAVALLAHEFGYSVALGAFIAGSLIAESGEAEQVERVIVPVRDMFVAIFFVSVGMLIDPFVIAAHWQAVAALSCAVILGKITGVSLGAFLSGNGTRTSVQAGMSLAQIGEFSFIIAGLGLSLDATRTFLYPIAVAVSAITTLTTPWLIRASGPAASLVDRKLPHRVQTFAALYGSWLERLRVPGGGKAGGGPAKRTLRLLLLDAALLALVIISAALTADAVTEWLTAQLGVAPAAGRALVVLGAFAVASPFAFGMMRLARQLGLILARAALPETGANSLDLAAAPRAAFVVALQIASVLLVGLPVLAITQPFLPGWPAALVLVLSLLLVGAAFWRSATELHGHVRAGAQVIIEALSTQTRRGPARASPQQSLASVQRLLPGLGEPEPVVLEPGSAAAGKTLAQLDLRGLTGATVLAIIRGEHGVQVPTADQVLREGDVLVLAGTHEAVEAGKQLLLTGKLPSDDGGQ